jgi:NAD(P)-dependent dehydrogenase (short-subunit alcohol dehydrogenase family)
MSSILGSVGGRFTGFVELYSASKAALNSLARSFALTDAAGRPVLCLHPGWVKTDMGGPGADLEIPE